MNINDALFTCWGVAATGHSDIVWGNDTLNTALVHGTVTCAARDERSRTAPALRATRRNTRTRQSECLPSAGAAASEVVWVDSGSSGLARPRLVLAMGAAPQYCPWH